MIDFTVGIVIERPVEDVFAYVSEPRSFPQWNSAVQDVRKTSAGETGLGAAYVMERNHASGPATNRLEVVGYEPPREFAIRAIDGPAPFLYRYRFEARGGVTHLHLEAEVELDGMPAAATPLARRAVKHGVVANLATLATLLDRSPLPAA